MKGLRKILRVSWTAKKTNEWALNKAGVMRELLDAVKARKAASVAAISSEWWGVVGRSPQRGPGAEPPVRESAGHSPPAAEKKLNFDSTKLL